MKGDTRIIRIKGRFPVRLTVQAKATPDGYIIAAVMGTEAVATADAIDALGIDEELAAAFDSMCDDVFDENNDD